MLDTDKIKATADLYKQINATENPDKIKSLAQKIVKTTSGEVARRGAYGSYLGLMQDFGNTEEPKQQAPTEPQTQWNFAPPNPVTQE